MGLFATEALLPTKTYDQPSRSCGLKKTAVHEDEVAQVPFFKAELGKRSEMITERVKYEHMLL